MGEDYSLVLARKQYPRLWRTCCTSVLWDGNWWIFVPILSNNLLSLFGIFLLESSLECCCSRQEQKALASRVALIKWREQAQQFKFPPTKRAVASSSLLINLGILLQLWFFSETSRSSLQFEHLSSKVLSRMRHNRT